MAPSSMMMTGWPPHGLYEHDRLRRFWHQFLTPWRKVVELKNEGQDVHVRLVTQGICIPLWHRVPDQLETFIQGSAVPPGPKCRTSEIHRLGVRCAKIASMAARATGLIRIVASLGLRRGKHATPDRRTGGVLSGCRQSPYQQQHRKGNPSLFHSSSFRRINSAW
jgi:hypothetical protein